MSKVLTQDIQLILKEFAKSGLPAIIIGEINHNYGKIESQDQIHVSQLKSPSSDHFDGVVSLTMPNIQKRLTDVLEQLPEPRFKYLIALCTVIATKRCKDLQETYNWLGLNFQLVKGWQRQLKEIFGDNIFD